MGRVADREFTLTKNRKYKLLVEHLAAAADDNATSGGSIDWTSLQVVSG